MMGITIEELIKGFKSYYSKMYENIEKSCQQGTLDFYGVRGMFRHLPLRYNVQNKMPEEVNQILDKCFQLLYEYSVEKGFIASNIAYEDFYEGKGLFEDSYPLSKRLNANSHDNK